MLGSGLNDFWIVCEYAGLASWLAGAFYFIGNLGVFSPMPLRESPTRHSALSLPVVGAVIVLFLMVQTAVVAAGVGIGIVPRSMLTGETSAAAQPETATATAPAVSEAQMTVIGNGILAVTVGLTIIPALLILPRLFRERWAGWGLHPRQLPKGVLVGLGGLCIVFPVLQAFGAGLEAFYRHFLEHGISEHATFEAMQQHISVGGRVLLCFGAIVVAPIYEEVFFRGIMQTALIQHGWGLYVPQWARRGAVPAAFRPSALQRWVAIGVTSLAFAWMHQWDQAPIIFVLALGLGYVYERTGNLWAPIVLHMAFNSTEILTYFSGS